MSLKRLNEILSSPERRLDLERRFWPKVAVGEPDACWPWVAKARHKFGYGMVAGGGGSGPQYAHCVAWGLSNGVLPDGAHILHHCDNPPCCNPTHVYAGTNAQNRADMKARKRGRLGIPQTEETKLKIGLALAGKRPKQTEEGRVARSEALKRRWSNPQWRERFTELTSGPNNPRFGKRPPEHQLEAVRRGHRKWKGYRHSEATKERMRQAALRREHAKRMQNGDT